MFKDLFTAFVTQFPQWRYRWMVIALMTLMAAVPVGELLIFRQFADLLVEGVNDQSQDPWHVVGFMLLFFLGFAGIRGLNHMTKFWRVRLFRRAFEGFQDEAGVGAASWQWSQAFSVSNGIADLIQITALLALILWLDLFVGTGVGVMMGLVLLQIAILYRRQIRIQRNFIADPARRVETGIRERIFSSEIAGIAASGATGLTLALIAWSTITGGTELTTAIVLAMGAKMFFGRVSGLAPIFMRFARDSLRLERDLGRSGGRAAAFDDDDEDELGSNRPRPDTQVDARDNDAYAQERSANAGGQMMIAAQRGDRDAFERARRRMGPPARWNDDDRSAVHAAESFLYYATASARNDLSAITAFWSPRPLPGALDEWVNPLLMQEATGRNVEFFPLLGGSEPPPHVLLGGAILDHANPNSVVAGAGASKRELQLEPIAQYLSLRGPMSARILRRSGGPGVDSFGDPRLLIRRVHRLAPTETNGRLAFVRNSSEFRIPYELPEGMDEIPIAASMPDEILGTLDTLSRYDGVVTSSLGVMALCNSYGWPSTLVVHERSPRAAQLEFQYRDYMLGAGLDAEWELHGVTAKLDRVDWRGRLVTETAHASKLDEIGDAVTLAILHHTEAQQDALERDVTPVQDPLE